MKGNFYKFLEHFETRPLMYIVFPKISLLNSFLLGFQFLREPNFFIDKKHRYPNFNFFTTWIGGILNYPNENSSGNWSFLIKEKYKTEKKSFEKFFDFLTQFKNSKVYSLKIDISNENKNYCLNNRFFKILCGTESMNEKLYIKNIKNIEKIFIFQLKPSKSLFVFLIDKNDSIIDDRNVDMTGKILLKTLNKQFNLKISNRNLKKVDLNNKDIIKYKIK